MSETTLRCELAGSCEKYCGEGITRQHPIYRGLVDLSRSVGGRLEGALQAAFVGLRNAISSEDEDRQLAAVQQIQASLGEPASGPVAIAPDDQEPKEIED